MNLRIEVLQRLLLGKSLLSRIRTLPVVELSQHDLAHQIVTAHDGAELILAAIADQKGKLPAKEKHFILDYLGSLGTLHPQEDVYGRAFIRSLNRVRVDLKHFGILPDPRQWNRVGDRVFHHASQWCKDYLGVSLEELDESELLRSRVVKKYLGEAKEAFSESSYKNCLEMLALALQLLFREIEGLRGLRVGDPDPKDAIKLAGFGVHANSYLALQEFLPKIQEKDDALTPVWKQSEFGHPGNWRKDAASFCLESFLDLALQIQDAEWIPGAVHVLVIYEQKVTALRDEVQIWQEKSSPPIGLSVREEVQKETVKVLKKGESVRGAVRAVRTPDLLRTALGGRGPIEKLLIFFSELDKEGVGHGFVNPKDVKITLIALQNEFVRKHFPGLPEMDWEPD